jgi:hypothetical protein
MTIYGMGNLSCGTWLHEGGNPLSLSRIGMLSWVLGFTSAAGYYTVRGDLRDTDGQAIEAWVDKYCRENPLNKIKDAAASLVDELSKTK